LAKAKGIAKEGAERIQIRSSVLETAPGYLAIGLAKPGKFRIIGSDISKDFAKEAGVDSEFLQSNVSNIMFPYNTFDFII
jgi:hypothetical protein